MARRISKSQSRSKARQAQRKIKQAQNKFKQGIRKVNGEIDKYNRAVRQHNNRVRANQRRLKSELNKLSRTRTTKTTTYVTYRTSVDQLSNAYTQFDSRAESNQLGPEYNHFLDLAERETANSVAVANCLLDTHDEAVDVDELAIELGDRLGEISDDLNDRWRGALFSFSPDNPDAARHFCTSCRELFTELLEISAPDESVFAAMPDAQRTDRGNATRRSKIAFLLQERGLGDSAFEDFVDVNIDNVVQLFHVLSGGTHGESGKFSQTQLNAIKKRVEDGLTFLTELIGNA